MTLRYHACVSQGEIDYGKLIQQLSERYIASQQRVYLEIVKGMVAVIRGGRKNRI